MLTTDHPRSRGVYKLREYEHTGSYGSSPLARGLVVLTLTLLSVWGIIPARAGFTPGTKKENESMTDHPRSRGVYHLARCPSGHLVGSSPLARGLHLEIGLVPVLVRIIPARAGFTVQQYASHRAGRDHPRSRGVYSEDSAGRCAPTGSSPLARGLLLGDIASKNYDGIIPARAGFTGAIWG